MAEKKTTTSKTTKSTKSTTAGKTTKSTKAAETEVATTDKPAKRKRDWIPNPKGGANMRKDQPTDAEGKAFVSQVAYDILEFYNLPKVKTDEECEERIGQFFLMCAENGQIPTVEKMALSLGIDTRTLTEWEHGRLHNGSRMLMVKKAKQFLSSFDADMLIKNKLNPVAYIFRAKNYYGMVDKTDVAIGTTSALGEAKSPEELESYYDTVVLDE